MFRYYLKLLISILLKVFYVFPIQKNRIFLLNELNFCYGDNLKYINEYIQKCYPKKFEIVYPLKEIIKISNVKIVKAFSFRYFYYALTSEVIITNSGGISYLPIRKKQIIINTWHGGGPYKKSGLDVNNNKWYLKELVLNAQKVDYYITTCRLCSELEAKALCYSKKQILEIGMPRNDIFFHDYSYAVNKVKKFYKIPDDYRILLYAPTFRSNTKTNVYKMEANELDVDHNKVIEELELKFGGKWIFCIRFHPKLKNISIDNSTIVNMTKYSDMQELLCAADCVITDYSSLMWDYSFTFKPCFIYANDLEEYELERGFYMSYKKWPFPVAKDEEMLIQNIRQFSKDDYEKNVLEHHESSGNFERGTSCASIINHILDKKQ